MDVVSMVKAKITAQTGVDWPTIWVIVQQILAGLCKPTPTAAMKSMLDTDHPAVDGVVTRAVMRHMFRQYGPGGYFRHGGPRIVKDIKAVGKASTAEEIQEARDVSVPDDEG